MNDNEKPANNYLSSNSQKNDQVPTIESRKDEPKEEIQNPTDPQSHLKSSRHKNIIKLLFIILPFISLILGFILTIYFQQKDKTCPCQCPSITNQSR
ncbi:MAG: hypothetical protein KA716_31740 [Gloeotrichia echinulata DEX184]|jgi:hypothetical protein|nr:hypothetical protein [Gloeotrichia echinulata DEX184]